MRGAWIVAVAVLVLPAFSLQASGCSPPPPEMLSPESWDTSPADGTLLELPAHGIVDTNVGSTRVRYAAAADTWYDAGPYAQYNAASYARQDTSACDAWDAQMRGSSSPHPAGPRQIYESYGLIGRSLGDWQILVDYDDGTFDEQRNTVRYQAVGVQVAPDGPYLEAGSSPGHDSVQVLQVNATMLAVIAPSHKVVHWLSTLTGHLEQDWSPDRFDWQYIPDGHGGFVAHAPGALNIQHAPSSGPATLDTAGAIKNFDHLGDAILVVREDRVEVHQGPPWRLVAAAPSGTSPQVYAINGTWLLLGAPTMIWDASALRHADLSSVTRHVHAHNAFVAQTPLGIWYMDADGHRWLPQIPADLAPWPHAPFAEDGRMPPDAKQTRTTTTGPGTGPCLEPSQEPTASTHDASPMTSINLPMGPSASTAETSTPTTSDPWTDCQTRIVWTQSSDRQIPLTFALAALALASVLLAVRPRL